MRTATKDSTVRGVVLSLLSAVVLLIPLSVALNRISFATSSIQGSNLADVFSSPPKTTAQEQVASPPPFGGDTSETPSIDTDSTDMTSSESIDTDSTNMISSEFSSPESDDSILPEPVTDSRANAPSPNGYLTANEFSSPEYDDFSFPADLVTDSSSISPAPSGNLTATEDVEADSSDSSTPWDNNAEVGVEAAGNGTSVVETEESYVSTFFDPEVQSPNSTPAVRRETDPEDTESLPSNSTQSVDSLKESSTSVEDETDGDSDNKDDLIGPDSLVSTEESTPQSTEASPASPLSEQSEDQVVSDPGVPSSSTSEILERGQTKRREAKRQRVFQPASVPHYSFVKFSAYRQSVHTFFVTGISSYVARTFDNDKIAHTCEWHPANGTVPLSVHSDPKKFVETKARIIFMKADENHGTYNPTIINCTFAKAMGADRKGGLLVLRISTGYDRWDPNLPVVAMEEQAGEVDIVMTPPEKLPFKYAFCGAPIHGKMSAEWILQWMTYHHYLAKGRGHFFFYNMGGLADSDKPKFQQFSAAGLLSITDIVDPNLTANYPTSYYHQVLLINDCLHRSRFIAERVFFFDYDEFVQIPAPDTLSEFMIRHKDQPWISLGSISANTRDCRTPTPGKSENLLERMLWRRPQPDCAKPESDPSDPSNPWLCIGPMGRRKYVVNPRQTFAAGVHWVTIPENGLDLAGQEARILHYQSAPLLDEPLCSQDVQNSQQEQAVLEDGWICDEGVANMYSTAKSFAAAAGL